MQTPPRCQSLLTSHTVYPNTAQKKPTEKHIWEAHFCDAWFWVFFFIRKQTWTVEHFVVFFFFLSARLHRRPTRMVEMTRERLARESVMFIPFRFGTSVMLRPPDALHFPTCGKGKACSRVLWACLWAATPAHTHSSPPPTTTPPPPPTRPTDQPSPTLVPGWAHPRQH